MRSRNKLYSYAPVLLRVGLSLVFLWFGSGQVRSPQAWVGYLPGFVSSIPISSEIFVIANGVFELIFGVFLLVGILTRLSAFLLGLHLLGIAATIGLDPTGVRDFGLAFSTIALALYGSDKWCIENSKRFSFLKPKGAKSILFYLIVILLLFFGLNASFILTSNDSINVNLNNTINNGTVLTNVYLDEAEVAKHDNENDCWLLISGKVYDATAYIPFHPGGRQEIISMCGTDATIAFETKGGRGSHSQNAHNILSGYYIGDLNSLVQAINNTSSSVGGDPTEPYRDSIESSYPGANIVELDVGDNGSAEFKFNYNGKTYEGKMNSQYQITKIE